LLGDESGQAFHVAAAWPDPTRDLQYLGATAQRALSERRGVVAAGEGAVHAAEQGAQVAYPIEVAGRLCGAVVVDIGGGGDNAALQATLRQIHWASAWLVDHFRDALLRSQQADAERLALLNSLTATALQHPKLAPSALAVANELAARLHCDRVAIGFERDERVEPLVLSHTAHFDRRSDLVRHLGEAMDEAFDLGVPVHHPASGDDALRALAHAETARALQVAAMLSVPLMHDGQPVGVISFERSDGPPFDDADLRLARAVGALLGPVWTLHRTNERSAWQRLRDAWRDATRALFGPRHPGWKMIGALSLLLLLLATLTRVEHRVSARTVIEGATQFAAVAPFNGFVAEGLVRAGDTVRQGQPLARLDDRELKLERARWASEREQLQRRHQLAMAGGDRAAMGVYAAQINQAEAQLALAEERLARVTLIAPFDGVVISGDLSQQRGAPVELGKLLFEVAPLEGYRVVLQVDDREIGFIATGQAGELVLSSLPGRALPFTVRNITPVALQKDGRNVFRVEAQLAAAQGVRLRPGMEGIGKVTVGQGSPLRVWTRNFADWLRLALWNWMP
jgi:RND family efflux transporter MFP subunit